MSKQPKLTVTIGAEDDHNGTTVIHFEGPLAEPITVTWHLGVTTVTKDFDADGMEETTYSDRFVANPPKKALGKFYERVRDMAIMAGDLQRNAESHARNCHKRCFCGTRDETTQLNATATADGVTIILNQGAIDAEAKRASDEDDENIDMSDVLGGSQQV